MDNKNNELRILYYLMNSAYMTEGGYLENIMSKFHKRAYKNTVVLTTNKELMRDGSIQYVEPGRKEDRNGISILRVDVSRYSFLRKTSALDGLLLYKETYLNLKSERPDFIIVDGVGSLGNFPIARYVRKDNPECIVVCISHATIENVDRHNHRIRRAIWDGVILLQNKYMDRYYKRVYGILPNAVDYMVNKFGIPQDKSGLLPLGYDDTLIDFEMREIIKKRIREHYGIDDNKYLIVHGGKLGEGKKTLEFVKSIKKVDIDVEAIIFGDFGTHIYGEKVSNQYELKVKEEAKLDRNHKILFTGALNQKEIYDLYLAADLAVFPGAPSCLRQEAVGAGLPIIMYINPGDEGININIDNNAIYLRDGWKIDDLSKAIMKIYLDKTYRERAEKLARGKYKEYSYGSMSKRIIEENIGE